MAKVGKSGLCVEVIVASPQVGRMALMKSVGDDRYRATVTIPPETRPADDPFAFFAVSNAYYINSVFLGVTLHLDQA